MKRRMSQGQAMRSTFASSRVTHFINTPQKSTLVVFSSRSRPGQIDPDLGVLLPRSLRASGDGEVESAVLHIEDRRPGPLRGRDCPECLVMVGVELANDRDSPV